VAYHDKWCDDPVDDNAEPQLNPHLSRLEHFMQLLVLHLAENRVHHNQQANCWEKAQVSKFSSV
jgi:hypothetical protein